MKVFEKSIMIGTNLKLDATGATGSRIDLHQTNACKHFHRFQEPERQAPFQAAVVGAGDLIVVLAPVNCA